MRRASCGVVLSLLLGGCVSVPEGELRRDLADELRSPENLSTLCRRTVTAADLAGLMPTAIKLTELKSSRFILGKKGKGSAKVVFSPKTGPACEGRLEFAFTQDATTKWRHKRASSVASSFSFESFQIL